MTDRGFHDSRWRFSWWHVKIFNVISGPEFQCEGSISTSGFDWQLPDNVVTCLFTKQVWSNGLLLGTYVVDSYSEKWQSGWMSRPTVYFIFGYSTGCVRASWSQKRLLWEEVLPLFIRRDLGTSQFICRDEKILATIFVMKTKTGNIAK